MAEKKNKMKRKGKNGKKKERKGNKWQIYTEIVKAGFFFCNGSPRPPQSPSPEPLSPSSKHEKSKIENSWAFM